MQFSRRFHSSVFRLLKPSRYRHQSKTGFDVFFYQVHCVSLQARTHLSRDAPLHTKRQIFPWPLFRPTQPFSNQKRDSSGVDLEVTLLPGMA